MFCDFTVVFLGLLLCFVVVFFSFVVFPDSCSCSILWFVVVFIDFFSCFFTLAVAFCDLALCFWFYCRVLCLRLCFQFCPCVWCIFVVCCDFFCCDLLLCFLFCCFLWFTVLFSILLGFFFSLVTAFSNLMVFCYLLLCFLFFGFAVMFCDPCRVVWFAVTFCTSESPLLWSKWWINLCTQQSKHNQEQTCGQELTLLQDVIQDVKTTWLDLTIY